MTQPAKENTNQFWTMWTVLNTLSFIVAFAIGGFVMLSFFANPGYEMGTHFQESRNTILFQLIVGIVVSSVQWLLLRRRFKVTWVWMIIAPLIIIIVDMLIFFIMGNVDVHWGEYADSRPYATPILIVAEYLLIGIFQSTLLPGHSSRIYSWTLASSLPWVFSLVVTIFGSSAAIWLTYFVLGMISYSAATGATLTWLMKPEGSRA